MGKIEDMYEKSKEEHRKLSKEWASIYDEKYGKQNPATESYMKFEEETIEDAIRRTLDKQIALDVGCGTGRITFLLARYFDKIRGYDFSPEMIQKANKKKTSLTQKVTFEAADIEDQLPKERNESISFVAASFGMGSFIRDVNTKLLEEIRRILKPRGFAVISFYNSRSWVEKFKAKWEPMLSAKLDKETGYLKVKSVKSPEKTYTIFARGYTRKEIEILLYPCFTIAEVATYPTLSAYLPRYLLAEGSTSEIAKIDKMIAYEKFSGGPYILATCQK